MDASSCTKESKKPVKKRASLGKQCVAFSCYNFFYKAEGNPTGLHFFKFPQRNPEKRQWCSLIKRVDGLDGFNVTETTFLCQEHFKDSFIKKIRNAGSYTVAQCPHKNCMKETTNQTEKYVRKAPIERSSSNFQLKGEVLEIPENTVSIQTNLSFVKKPIFLDSLDNDFSVDHEYTQGHQKDGELVDLVNLRI